MVLANSVSLFRIANVSVYPNGVGDAANQYLSAFVRTKKSATELNNDNWTRPISYFSVKLKHPSQSDVDIVAQFSEPEFQEFSESQAGKYNNDNFNIS